MGRHDAALKSFGQWWRRVRRAGHAYAERGWRQRGAAGWLMRRRVLSILFWAGVPVVGLAAAWPTSGISVAIAAAMLLWLAVRVVRLRRRMGDTVREAQLYAVFCVLGKLAEGVGVLGWWWRRDTTDAVSDKRAGSETSTGEPAREAKARQAT